MTRAKWGLAILATIGGLLIADTAAYLSGGYPNTLSAVVSWAGQQAPLLAAVVPFVAGVLYGHWFFSSPPK